MTTIGPWDLLSILGVVLSFMAVLFVMMVLYNQRRHAHYDADRHRMELELMRRSVETQLYALTEKLVATEARWRDANHLLIASQDLQPAAAKLQQTPITPFLEAAGISPSDARIEDDLVFILTPFHPQHRDEFEVIASVCRELGLKARRGDEEFVRAEIFSHILRQIVRARLIIANVEGRNPNVFYELGIAHAIGKLTILVAQTPSDVPFDIRAKRLILYRNLEELRDLLRAEVARALVAGEYRGTLNDTPHTDRH